LLAPLFIISTPIVPVLCVVTHRNALAAMQPNAYLVFLDTISMAHNVRLVLLTAPHVPQPPLAILLTSNILAVSLWFKLKAKHTWPVVIMAVFLAWAQIPCFVLPVLLVFTWVQMRGFAFLVISTATVCSVQLPIFHCVLPAIPEVSLA
jgi:hypothetical protein